MDTADRRIDETSPAVIPAPRRTPQLVLCAVEDDLAEAWLDIARDRPEISVHRGSILELDVDAVVSPANSYGWMRGGIDAVYAQVFPQIEETVRRAVLTYHGGELPVGEALVVRTGRPMPAWLVSAPTMREPGERLPKDTVHPYLAARAVFRLWTSGRLESGTPLRRAVSALAMPGLGTGVGGVSPQDCARQIAAAWDEVMA
ncbi:macro domain-containing protein [Allokutzneria multivorans]|uniref:Macro domain-containing protein n=1 Tax=Allokutzneria multivorans TaxID=1142134 RepID=A0ABP7REK1_9PSEU